MPEQDGQERVTIALVCTECGERMELDVEQATRVAAGLMAAASGMPIGPEQLKVRGDG